VKTEWNIIALATQTQEKYEWTFGSGKMCRVFIHESYVKWKWI